MIVIVRSNATRSREPRESGLSKLTSKPRSRMYLLVACLVIVIRRVNSYPSISRYRIGTLVDACTFLERSCIRVGKNKYVGSRLCAFESTLESYVPNWKTRRVSRLPSFGNRVSRVVKRLSQSLKIPFFTALLRVSGENNRRLIPTT